MSRPLRIEYPGALYHVTSRGNERKDIFFTTRDKEKFLEILEAAHKRFNIIVHGYCLMTNHYHFLIETAKSNLSKCMQYINSTYTTYFNLKRKRAGHLFQGRYTGILVQEESYLIRLSRYIHLNPVRAKVERRPADFEWSSYRYYANKSNKKPAFLNTGKTLQYFDKDIQKYKEFVEEGLKKEMKNPSLEAFANLILGEEEFVERIKKEHIDKDKKQRDLPALRKINASIITPERIFKTIKEFDRRIDPREKKKLEAYFLRSYTDFSLEEISAKYISGLSASGLSSMLRRFEGEINNDEEIRRRLAGLVRKMSCDEV